MTGRVLNENNLHRQHTSHLKQQLAAAEFLLADKRKNHALTGKIINTVQKLHHRLNRPWRIAILGEVNSGKTTAINVLLGGTRLPTQAFANTHIHTLIHYSAAPQITVITKNGKSFEVNAQQISGISDIAQINVGLPTPILHHLELLDCPGTSDYSQLQENGEVFRSADAAIWCTSSIAPLRKNEIDCWREIPPHIKKHGILLVTRKDQLDDESQSKVFGRLKYETRKKPFEDIIFLSATEALTTNEDDSEFEQHWKNSGAYELDQSLMSLLTRMQVEREKKLEQMISRVTKYFIDRL